MLNAISWQQYTTAILLLAIAWYSYVGLRYYQSELSAFLKIKTKSPSIIPPVANKLTAVMGEAKPDADTGLYQPEELLFARSEPDELIFSNSQPDEISDQTLPKGPADDLMAEAETLVCAFEETDNKPEFLSLLKLLVSKYDIYADEISLTAIINSLKNYAASKLPFQIKETEWPLNF